MVDVKVDGKALNEFINYYDPLLLESYEDGNCTWYKYEHHKSVLFNHTTGDNISLVLTFSMNFEIDGTAYVRDVDHILICPIHEDDLDSVRVLVESYNVRFIDSLNSRLLSDY